MIQNQVLNSILANRDSLFIVGNNLTEEFFSDYKKEFNYIKNHIDVYGNTPDLETFLTKFPDFDVFDVKESSVYLLDALYDERNKRFLADAFNKIKDLLNEGKVDDAMTYYASTSSLAVEAKHLESFDYTQDTKERYETYINKCDNFEKFYIKTGFKELDDIIGGWDRREELATIAARSGQSKTWVLLKMAIAALEQGLRVGLYSGEMSETKVSYRLDTIISHISNYGLMKGDRQFQNQYKLYLDSLNSRYTGCLKILTPPMIAGPAGVTALRAFIEKENLDILFIDQHSLLEDDRKAKNPVEKAANISKDLKNLQVMKKIPIIAVSQQNRSSTENGVGTEHIAQSDRIAQDSTIILFFEKQENILTMHLVKSRDSENGKDLKYSIDLNRGTWTYIPDTDGSTVVSNSFESEEDEEEEVFTW